MLPIIPMIVLVLTLSSGVYAGNTPELSHHQLRLGAHYFLFYGDLGEEQNHSLGPSLNYQYVLTDMKEFRPLVGLELAYYNAKKDGYENKHVLVLPHWGIRADITNDLTYDMLTGLEIDQWEQSKTFITEQTLHSDILFGCFFRGAVGYLLAPTQLLSLHLGLTLHLQEFNFDARYWDTSLIIAKEW